MDPNKLRAWWWAKQGLDGSLDGKSAAAVLERSGWARSVGGVGPYLTLYARAGIARAEADRAVAALEIHELPAARACTYVVPASEFALALKVGSPFRDADMKTAAKLGVTDKEMDKLCAAVVKAVARAPLDPEEIREAVGGAARSLGEAGKQKGMNSTLPIALGRLQVLGEIRRVPVNGRLDQQRYKYVAWRENPLAKLKLTDEEALVALARRYFRWVGPATVAEFQWFAGATARAAKAALAPLALVPVEEGSDRLLLPDERDAFARFKPPAKPRYALVSSLDALFAHRRELATLLDAKDAARPELRGDGRAGGSLMDLPSHAIVDRGRIVGLWEYDMDARSIAWRAWIARDKALAAAVDETAAWVRDHLGDARSFSLDSPKSRAARIAVLRG